MSTKNPKIRAEFELSTEELVLYGIEGIKKYPLLLAFVRKLHGFVSDDNVVRIPTTEEELSSRYQTLSRLLERLKLEMGASGHAASALKAAEDNEGRFLEFSAKAKEIWHAAVDKKEFEAFIGVVGDSCPGRTFYRKQLLSAFHLAFSQNACNFSVPGAGKTSIVYAAYSFLKSLPEEHPKSVDRLLVVGPLSSFKAWEDEYAEIFGCRASSKRIAGGISAIDRRDFLRGISVDSRDTELVLTSYQTLYKTDEDFRAFLSRVAPRTMVVLDEAHYVKGLDGEWAKAALSLAPIARSRVVLTGTPAPNGYEDLSNLFRFLYPERDIVGFPVSSLRAMTDGTMSRSVAELKERIQPFYTRIKKQDLDLPAVQEQVVAIAMSSSQTKIYRDLEGRIVPSLKRQFDNPQMALRVRARLIRLRQAAANPSLLLRPLSQEDGIFDTGGTGEFNISEAAIAEQIRMFDHQVDLERLSSCKHLAESILQEQGKVLIWSYFLGNLEMLKQAFEHKVGFVEVLTGATPVAGQEVDDSSDLGTREAIIDRFHTTSEKAILIANPQAVGESISLHKACRSAIYFDRDFNAGRFIQSKDRIHRYSPNRGKEVNYYYLIAGETVDDDIAARLLVKERRLSDLVDSDDIPILTSALDGSGSEDIRKILESYERRKSQ